MELLSIKEVCRLLKVARETLRRWEHDGQFPKRIRLSGYPRGRAAYLKSEVDHWIGSRPR
jgi:predicted DNA-binding transcriptional regulator AlpA